MATNVGGRSNFSDGLDVLVEREVETDTREKLIGPIQQDEIAAEALRIAVQDVAAVRGHVHVPAETTIYETNQTKVTDIATRARATLHLVEAGEVIGLVEPPAIERDDTHTERIVRTGKANLRTEDEVIEVALTVQAIHKRRIRQIARRDGERQRHRYGQIQSRRRKRGRCQNDAGQDAADRRTDTREVVSGTEVAAIRLGHRWSKLRVETREAKLSLTIALT